MGEGGRGSPCACKKNNSRCDLKKDEAFFPSFCRHLREVRVKLKGESRRGMEGGFNDGET